MGTRSYLVLAAVVVLAAALGTGCRNRSRSGGPRGGDSGTTRIDAGDDGSRDGGITLPDTGPRDSGGIVVRDTGGPECLSNADCLTSEMCSGGLCVPRMTMSCPTHTIPPWTGSACSATTRTCITDCGSDNACANACVDSDVPECGECVNNQSIVCYNRMGCQDEWNCFWQCVLDNGCSDRTCVESFCGPEDDAYAGCAMAATGSCTEVADCFP